MTNTKIKLFTDSDLDGVSCGLLANIIFDDNVEIEYCSPKTVDKKLIDFITTKDYEGYSKVFITDLVLKEATAEIIDKHDKFDFRFKLFDHHRSNYTNSKYTWVNVYEKFNGRKTCGTELFWNHLKEYYVPDYSITRYIEFDKYVEYVRLWDTWDWIESGESGLYARDLNTIYYVYSITGFISNISKRLINRDSELISKEERKIIKLEESRKDRYIRQKMRNIRILKVKDYNIAYVFAESFISELGNFILKNVDNIKYVAIINTDTNVVSLRALESSGVNLADVAKSYSTKGGGHQLSAGFVFDKAVSEELVNTIFNI